MPTVTIDGVQYEGQAGQSVIQVALDNGIDVPHFCWHPGLSVAGNCRMCIVDVEKIPKPSIACGTTIADGMVVHTQNEKALKAREDVMEFLLINHPLDCPICDEAGQCKLQDYAFNHSRGESRFEEIKNHKDKRVPFGPNVLFDGERCISCSRCIRFSEEIADQPVLTFVQRGDHVTIQTFPGTEFDNPYSMNVIDICPVGALTSRDFRFKARAWDMSFTETVCAGCARGCSMRVGARNNEILRLEPRPNPNVNEFWMCDAGRLETYPSVNAEDRISGAHVLANGTRTAVSIHDAVEQIAASLKHFKPEEIAFVASPFATLEDNFMFLEAAKQRGAKHVGYFEAVSGEDAKLLIRADKSPNAYSLGILGVKPFGSDFESQVASATIKAVYALEDDFFSRTHLHHAFSRLEFFACHARNMTPTASAAHVMLPAASWAEKEGVFINFEGWAQKLVPAVATAHVVGGFDHLAQSRLDKFGTPFDKWSQSKKKDAMESWRLAQHVANALGAKHDYRYTEDVFEAAAHHLAELNGLSYDLLASLGRPLNGIDKPFKESIYREVYQIDTLDEIPELS
jgi:NADH-quinone oxidoreductase subunit G